MRSGEARDDKEGRAVSCAYFEAHVQNVERGGPIEGSLIERGQRRTGDSHHRYIRLWECPPPPRLPCLRRIACPDSGDT